MVSVSVPIGKAGGSAMPWILEPSRDLFEALRQATRTATEVLVLAPRRSGLDPWETLAAGATDVLEWDGDPDPVAAAVERRTEVQRLLTRPEVSGAMVGHSPALRQVLRDVVVAARFGQGPILVLGETGTGKELVARVVHAVRAAVGAATGRLVVVDCTTIVPALSGSELSGHAKAFTGAAGRTGGVRRRGRGHDVARRDRRPASGAAARAAARGAGRHVQAGRVGHLAAQPGAAGVRHPP